jgi:hypothetical protein
MRIALRRSAFLGTLELANVLLSGLCFLCASKRSEDEEFILPGEGIVEIEGEGVVEGGDGFLMAIEVVQGMCQN